MNMLQTNGVTEGRFWHRENGYKISEDFGGDRLFPRAIRMENKKLREFFSCSVDKISICGSGKGRYRN